MDITPQFKVLVDDAENNQRKMKNKHKSVVGHDSDDQMLPDKNRILPNARRKKSKNIPKDPFEIRARDIVDNITRLREFLAESRTAYIDVLNVTGNAAAHGGSTDFYTSSISSGGFTDLDRDKIDARANTFIRKTNQLIAKFKADLKEKLGNQAAISLTGHQTQHLEAVCDILEHYLRAACQSHAKQKAIRVEKELEIQKLSRLELNARSSVKDSTSGSRSSISTTNFFQRTEIDDRSLESSSDLEVGSSGRTGEISSENGDVNVTTKKGKLHRHLKKLHPSNRPNSEMTEDRIQANSGFTPNGLTPTPAPVPNISVGYQYSSDDDAEMNNNIENNLSPEEIQAYEQENEAMYDDLVSLRDNVEQIENKVVKIAQLQEVFTEKGMPFKLPHRANIGSVLTTDVRTPLPNGMGYGGGG